jgi:hypothetical protein
LVEGLLGTQKAQSLIPSTEKKKIHIAKHGGASYNPSTQETEAGRSNKQKIMVIWIILTKKIPLKKKSQ